MRTVDGVIVPAAEFFETTKGAHVADPLAAHSVIRLLCSELIDSCASYHTACCRKNIRSDDQHLFSSNQTGP